MLLKKIAIIKHKIRGKEDPCPYVCGKRKDDDWGGKGEKDGHTDQTKIFFLWKMKGVAEKKAREDQTVRSLCWCDEGPALGRSGDGEQSVHCGHGWTTQPLHKCPFLKRGKEMLRFTVTTSRLYNVNVKLHWGVPWKEPSPPIRHTRTLTLFMFQGIPLTQQPDTFSVYTER